MSDNPTPRPQVKWAAENDAAVRLREHIRQRLLVSAEPSEETVTLWLALTEITTLRARVDILAEALRPFAAKFLWPDDESHPVAKDARSQEGWSEQRNDDRIEPQSTRRGDIRAARETLRAAKKEAKP